jgi:hypothetical protein
MIEIETMKNPTSIAVEVFISVRLTIPDRIRGRTNKVHFRFGSEADMRI